MALTMPRPRPMLNGEYHKAWRVAFVVLPLAFAMGITVAVFLFVPPVRNSIELALEEGGVVFVAAVIVPSGIFSLITTGLAIRILWRISEGVPSEEN